MKFSAAGVVLCILTARSFAAAPAPSIIPLPRQMQVNSGVFTLCPTLPNSTFGGQTTTKILVDAASQETGQYLAGVLFRATGFQFEVQTNAATSAVQGALLLTTSNALSNLGQEGYELTVNPDSVAIRAPGQAGMFYGVQSLLQLLPPQVFSQRPVTGVAWTAPCVYIQDQPRFVWRGFMMDSVRHFFTKDEVRAQLDTMAMHKLNMFHWHLDDDSGWRIEIKSWPLLTQTGAWRTNFMWDLNPRSSTQWRNDGLYGGYYTQDEIREIVAYAAQRHITIVPEIEMPGHSTALVSAYPELSCNGTNNECPVCFNVPHSLSVTAYSGGVFCAARTNLVMPFVQSVLTEVMSLFPSPYIHIGGDEVNFSNWKNHSLDRTFTNTLGIGNITNYQSHFTQQIANWIKRQGRQMIGWSEIMNGDVLTNAAVMDWQNGTLSKAVQTATNGEYVVMAPSAVMYINKWENATNGNGSGVIWSNDAPAQQGYVPLTNVYNFEPIPAGLPAAYTNYILGAEGPCWSEWIPSRYNMEFKAYPRLSAIAELTWTPAYLKDFNSFSNRLTLHKQRLDWMGVNYNHTATPPQVASWTQAQISTSYQTLQWDITSSITNSGEIDLTFCWKTGANGLDIAWAAVIENGIEIDRDTHAGFTGASPVKPLYVLKVPIRNPSATYLLRASVAGRGGNISNGIIYFPNWN